MFAVDERMRQPGGKISPGGSTTNNVVAIMPAGACVWEPFTVATWEIVIDALTSSCHTVLAPSSTIIVTFRLAAAAAAVKMAEKLITATRCCTAAVNVQSVPAAGFAT